MLRTALLLALLGAPCAATRSGKFVARARAEMLVAAPPLVNATDCAFRSFLVHVRALLR